MFIVTKPAANRVDIAVSGEIGSAAMDEGLKELLELSEGVENGRMLSTIASLTLPTVGAVGVEFQYLPKLFGLLGKFDKCAVVSDAAWLRTAAEIEGKVFPGIEIKAFQPSEHDSAEAWLEA